MSDDTIILRPFRADDAEWLAARHGVLYAEQDGFDESFAPLVAEILAGFLQNHEQDRERGWIAQRGETRLGSIFCVKLDDKTAKLRLFLVEPEARGQGLGKHLLEVCITFARQAGYQRLTLWTHESHEAACALYQRNGFACVNSFEVHSFGQDLVEQTWEIAL